MDMSQISVKWSDEGVFRRFPLAIPANGDTYGALMTKIVAIQPAFNKSLAWKDSEGDLVVFQSTTELTEAVNAIKADEPLRIFTVNDVAAAKKDKAVSMETSDAPTVENNGDPALHPNVICDGCDTEVRGIRFKCMGCPDYDLCSGCEQAGKHRQHPMIRITDPNDKSWMGHHMRHMRRMCRQGGGGGGGMGGHHGHGPHHQGHHNFWTQMHKMRQAMAQGQQQGQAGNNNGAGANQQQPAPGATEFLNNSADYLRAVGMTVADALTHLGISVDVDVEHDGQREKVAEPNKGGETGEKPAAEQQKQPTAPAQQEQEQMQQGEGDAVAEQPNANQSPNEEEAQKTPPPQDWTMVERSDEADDKPQTNTVTATNTVENNNGSTTTTSTTTTTTEQPQKVEYPNLVGLSEQLEAIGQHVAERAGAAVNQVAEMVHSVHHPDPLVNKTLNDLMAMGFDNQDGWLQQLVEAKRGDINAVLNALAPAQQGTSGQ